MKKQFTFLFFFLIMTNIYSDEISLNIEDHTVTRQNSLLVAVDVKSQDSIVSVELRLNGKQQIPESNSDSFSPPMIYAKVNYNLTVARGQNLIIVTATNTKTQTTTKYLTITREFESNDGIVNIVRKFMFHLLKRLF